MKTYDVVITETLEKKISVRAESLADAEEKAEEEWKKAYFDRR